MVLTPRPRPPPAFSSQWLSSVGGGAGPLPIDWPGCLLQAVGSGVQGAGRALLRAVLWSEAPPLSLLPPSPGVRPTPQSEGSSPAPSSSPCHPSLHLLLEGPEWTHSSKSVRTPESQCPYWQNGEISDLPYLTRLSWGLNDVRHA